MGQPELTELGRKVAELQDRAPEARLDALAGRARLVSAPVPRPARALAKGTLALAASFAALVFAALMIFRATRPRDPLHFALGDEAGSVGAWIASPTGEPRELHFSDGSQLRLGAGGRARVTSVDADGAEVALEQGSLQVSIVHRDRTRWRVRGGPFVVHVVGTRFEIRWDPASERFDVALLEGSVMLSGPVVGDARAVRVGERLSIHKSTLEVSSTDAATSATEAPLAPPPSTVDASLEAPTEPTIEPARSPRTPSSAAPRASESTPRSATTDSTASPPATAPSVVSAASSGTSAAAPATPPAPELRAWQRLAREARYKEALAEVEREGFDAACASASGSELRELGDISRLGGGGARTLQVYAALRKRFPGSADAARAAFILGRMAQDQSRNYPQAAGWFMTYLSEQPRGEFAADALGRLVEAADRTGDEAAAVRAAERYLAAYPNGPHAAYASRVIARRASR